MSITFVVGAAGAGKSTFIINELHNIIDKTHRQIWYQGHGYNWFYSEKFKKAFNQKDLPSSWEDIYPDGSIVVLDRDPESLSKEVERIILSQKNNREGENEIHIYISAYDESELPKEILALVDRQVDCMKKNDKYYSSIRLNERKEEQGFNHDSDTLH